MQTATILPTKQTEGRREGVSNQSGTQGRSGSAMPLACSEGEGFSPESSLCYGGSKEALGLVVSPIRSL